MRRGVKYQVVFFVVMIGIVMTSCVSHKAKYRGNWERLEIVQAPVYTVYLIGDAGNASDGKNQEVLDYLGAELDQEDEKSAIVWLGDNIYPVGLAPDNSVYSKEGRKKLLSQLNTMSNYKGQKYFVPGNHDWYTYGRIGLRRQELFVDSFLNVTPNPTHQKDFFLPNKGCGDPQVVKLTNDIGLLLMDSHWYLNEKARKGDQSVCEVNSAKEFMDKLESEILENSEKSLLIASHHPPYTYAHHGGKFPLKDDLFPLTQKVDWLYLPLPFIGFALNRLRIRISEQDVYHPMYRHYRATLIQALEAKGNSIVASGHEHTLQYIEKHGQYFIVSGAATKNNKVGLGSGSKFGIGERGYVKLSFLDSKNVHMQFVVPGQFEEYNNIAYEKMITLN